MGISRGHSSLRSLFHGPLNLPGSREIVICKPQGVPFGFFLCTVGQSVHVVRVEQYTQKFALTPAYRSGISFGNRLEAINHTPVEPSDLGICRAYSQLQAASEVQLTVDENPSCFKVARAQNGESLGLEFSEGRVSSVLPFSPAERAGVSVGDVIVQLNSYCTLEMGDQQLFILLECARAEKQDISLSCMRPEQANQLIEGCRRIMRMPNVKKSKIYVFANETLALDAHLTSNNTSVERVYVKGKQATSPIVQKSARMFRSTNTRASMRARMSEITARATARPTQQGRPSAPVVRMPTEFGPTSAANMQARATSLAPVSNHAATVQTARSSYGTRVHRMSIDSVNSGSNGSFTGLGGVTSESGAFVVRGEKKERKGKAHLSKLFRFLAHSHADSRSINLGPASPLMAHA